MGLVKVFHRLVDVEGAVRQLPGCFYLLGERGSAGLSWEEGLRGAGERDLSGQGCEGGGTRECDRTGDMSTKGPREVGGHGSQVSQRAWFSGFSSLLRLPGGRWGVNGKWMELRQEFCPMSY